MTFRPYDQERDYNAVLRIYREVGWVSETAHEQSLKHLSEAGHGLVAEIHGDAECFVTAHDGVLRHQTSDLPLCAVTGVTTSRITRKQGLAGRLTAQLLAESAQAGKAVAILGVFEQGYYNRLGFGNGCYEHWYRFDPAHLQIPVRAKLPVRLAKEDWQAMHEGRLGRLRGHGACSILAPSFTQAETFWADNGFGLGYLDASGALSHHMWCDAKGESGPYRVYWMAYQTKDHFLELMALIKSLEEQVHSISVREPPGIQLQDFVRTPFRLRSTTRRSEHESSMTATAYWQVRMLDVSQCLEQTVLDCAPVRFHLALSDPVERYLPADAVWRGTEGDYLVTLGPESSATRGSDPGLPTLRASVNAFTRLWLGVRPATSLSWTDDLEAPPTLLEQLDRVLRFPTPLPDWDF